MNSNLISRVTDRVSEERHWRRIYVLDNLERVIVLAFYLQMVARMCWNAYHQSNPATLLLLPSEGLVVILLLVRRSARDFSTRWQDWIAALFGTALPTLVITSRQFSAFLPIQIAAFAALVGLIVQLHGKCCLGRSFGIVAANRGVKCVGPYRYVRHPIYAGYLLGHIAFLCMFPCLWNVLMLGAGLVFQIYRLMVEEQVLSLDKQYLAYKQRVRYRLVPGLF